MAILRPRPALALLVTLLLVGGLWNREPILLVPSSSEPHGCVPSSASSSATSVLPKNYPSLREQVELATQQEDRPFPRAAVLNLASRPDRKKHMQLLDEVHSLNLTFVDATPSSSPEIIWLQERLYDDSQNISWTFNVTANETWKHHFLSSSPLQLRPPPSLSLPPSASTLLNFPQAVRGVDSLPGPLACFVSHLNLLRRIVAEDWGTTIVLEDDVDLEWRFKEIWEEVVERSIPKELEWHLLYLGYIFSSEERFRPVHHPGLRPAASPLGAYSYAVSRQGAIALLALLSQPENFVDAPVDHIFRRFNTIDQARHRQKFEERQVLSFAPAMVAHGGKRAFGTDIGGTSNSYVTKLADSTMDRFDRFHEAREEEGRGGS